ncbi:MAG: amidohydrolase, partial [Gemmatimonadaceae bacterium]
MSTAVRAPLARFAALRVMRISAVTGVLLAVASGTPLVAQNAPAPPEPKDPLQEGLQLKPTRTIAFTTKVGHWMSVDLTPDGQTLVFDLLGDLYTLPASGGKATPLTHGMAFDGQPRISPDGKRVVFVSDRDGGWNVFIMSLDKRDTLQLTRGKTNTYESPEWTPDGKYIVVTRNMKLHMFHVDGGSGQQLIREPATLRTMGAAFGADPRYIWFAQRTGQWVYNTPMSDYDLAVYDRNTGQTSIRENRWGSAFRPTLSPDGRWLVYGTRHIDSTRLRIRDLRNGDERWLVMRTQRDDQESRATLDVLPGMTFTPDSRSLITTWDGKLWKVPVEGNAAPTEIPFEAEVSQALGPYVEFTYPISDSSTFVVKQIRDAVPSPDGARLAFVAMDRLYLMDWPNGTPRRATNMEIGEFEPTWSPDGQSIAYTTASPKDGGHIYKVGTASGARPQRLTTGSFLWQRPVFTPDGQRIVTIRAPFRAYEQSVAGNPGGGEDIAWIPASGGEPTVVAPSSGLSLPHFTKDQNRIYLYSGQRGLVSMRWDGTDQQTHLRVTQPAPPGGGGGGGGAPPGGPPAVAVFISPNGGEALAQVSGDMYIVSVPVIGGTEPTIVVGGPETAFPVRRLSDIGGQFPVWRADGREVHWSIGNAHVVYDVEAGRAFDDSVRRSRRDAPAGADSARGASRTPVLFKPFEKRIILTAQRDIPRQSVVLRGARLVTMKGKEVIENGDIVIKDNRIVAVGARGTVPIPAGARSVDVSGKTIIPGFVDTHAHVRATFDIHREQVWSYQVNLAYGVTTLRDPQTASTDVLSYEDMVMAGRIVGPRIYSTGPGVFGAGNPQGNNLTSLEQARTILKRYSQYYDTKTIKEYQVGNREQRQWVIMAANE